jgi:hypothetical protein
VGGGSPAEATQGLENSVARNSRTREFGGLSFSEKLQEFWMGEDLFSVRWTMRLQGVGTQESGVAGVAEYVSKVFIQKSRTSIFLGKSSPSSQIL